MTKGRTAAVSPISLDAASRRLYATSSDATTQPYLFVRMTHSACCHKMWVSSSLFRELHVHYLSFSSAFHTLDHSLFESLQPHLVVHTISHTALPRSLRAIPGMLLRSYSPVDINMGYTARGCTPYNKGTVRHPKLSKERVQHGNFAVRLILQDGGEGAEQ